MRLFIDISGPRLDKIDQLIAAEKYKDAYQFIYNAIDTQIQIEELGNVGMLKEEGSSYSLSRVSINSPSKIPRIPEIFSHTPLKIQTSEPNEAKNLWDENNLWIWGQINSVFAMKVCVRAVANIINRGNGTSAPLVGILDEIRINLKGIHDYLIFLDEKFSRERDSLYSKSFPTEEENSLSRFQTQYIGVPKTKKLIESALAKLGFANISPDFNVKLTEYGLKFAMSLNPILDEPESEQSKHSLSDDEISIYLDAVKKFSLPESNSISTIARKIHQGKDTPQTLDEALSIDYPEWTGAQVTTYRVGTISRMMDLRMLTKEKSEAKKNQVRYKLADDNSWIKNGGLL